MLIKWSRERRQHPRCLISVISENVPSTISQNLISHPTNLFVFGGSWWRRLIDEYLQNFQNMRNTFDEGSSTIIVGVYEMQLAANGVTYYCCMHTRDLHIFCLYMYIYIIRTFIDSNPGINHYFEIPPYPDWVWNG